MKNYKLHISEGFKDTYGKEMVVKKHLENSVLNTFTSFGYEHIKTPAVEYIDVYSTNGIQKPDLYNLINRQGEVLSLCNDMTSSIARFVATNDNDSNIRKYCYVADTFRYPRLYQGKNHQFLQAGVELVADKNIANDVECIYLAAKALKNANVSNFTIHLGSALFLETLLADFNVNENAKDEIYTTIEAKDFVSLRSILDTNLDEEKSNFVYNLILRGGRLRYIEDLMQRLEGLKSYDVLDYLKSVYKSLRELNLESIIFDFSIYSYANYYTGIIFAIYADNVTKELVSGGRCDNLYKEFGKDYGNIGFGLDLDALTQYVLENDLIDIVKEKYISISDDRSYTFSIAKDEFYRDNGVVVNHMNLSLEDAKAYAKANGYSKVIEYTNLKMKMWEVE